MSANISSIFFVDDIVLLGKSTEAFNDLMRITRTFFLNHHLDLSETKSKIMTSSAATGKVKFLGSSNLSSLTLEQVVSFKYLGIPLSTSPYGFFRSFNDQVKTKANNYLHSVLSLVRTGPDRSDLAHALWTRCALPSILYGSEIIPLNQGTIHEIEKCQTIVGKFILQLPRNSTNVSVYIDAGLKPVWAMIAERVLNYASNVMSKPPSFWPKLAMGENLSLGEKSPYLKYLIKWKEATNFPGPNRKQIRNSVTHAAISSVLAEQKTSCVTSFAMNCPYSTDWFKPKPWVNDSCFSKILSEFRSCNAGLGNRGPTKDGRFFKLCPLCSGANVNSINNEVSFNSILFPFPCFH